MIIYFPMSLPSLILPIGNHYNEFDMYPVNVFILFKCVWFCWPIQRLFPFLKKIYLFYLFIFGCVGSSLLHVGFL